MQLYLAILGVTVVVLAVRLFFLERKLGILLGGKESKSLEALVFENAARLQNISESHETHNKLLRELEKRFLFSVQKIGVLRFNPFTDTGSDQSFVIALLDGNDTGVVFSSLYVQGHPLLYAKPIDKGRSKYKLSREELEVLATARGKA